MKKFFHVIAVGVLSAGVLAACGESEIEPTEEATGSEQEQKAEEGQDDSQEEKTKELGIGDSVTFDGLELTLNSVAADQGNDFETPQEDKYLIVDMTVKNTTEESKTVSSIMNLSLKDTEGYKYDMALYSGIKSQLDGEVAPGDTLRGQIAFDVPESETYELLFDDPFTSGQAVWTIPAGEIE